MKEYNRIYKLCDRYLGRTSNKISVSFETKFPEHKEIRRNDVNHLYFSIIDSIISQEQIENLYKIRTYLRSVDGTGYYDKLISDILDNITNGKMSI